ncbi:MAG: hypothetical protein AAF560_19890 [Acidobacteriota bacterium]
MTRTTSFLLLLLLVVPSAAWAQPGRPGSPGALGPLGPATSDLDRANRLRDTSLRDTSVLATMELSYRASGDLKTALIKHNPQNLFVTLEVDGEQLKKLAKNKKPKLQEAVPPGVLMAKGRWSRPGKRYETHCGGNLNVGFQKVIFFPYGGEEGFFGCEILPRLLPDKVFNGWKDNLEGEQLKGYNDCAGVHPRGSSEFWSCIENSEIPFPQEA